MPRIRAPADPRRPRRGRASTRARPLDLARDTPRERQGRHRQDARLRYLRGGTDRSGGATAEAASEDDEQQRWEELMQRDPIHTRNEHREGAPEERKSRRGTSVCSLWPDDEHLQFHILGGAGS